MCDGRTQASAFSLAGEAARVLDGMTVAGFWSAFFGSIVVSITGWLASAFISDHGRVEVITTERS